MRRATILKILGNTSVVVGLGAMSLFGGIARAESFQSRVQAELNTGKDYSTAWAAASLETGPLYASDGNKPARSAMYQGKDYLAAHDEANRSAPRFSTEQIAKAAKAREEINAGEDYVAAWGATSKESAAHVQSVVVSGGASGHDRTRSKK
jgi:hypothetical protein